MPGNFLIEKFAKAGEEEKEVDKILIDEILRDIGLEHIDEEDTDSQ